MLLRYYVLNRKTSFSIQCMMCTQIYFYPNNAQQQYSICGDKKLNCPQCLCSSGPHTHTHTHKKRKNLIGISFNPLTICKKHTRLVADGLWVSVRVHHPNGHYDFDYYHWVYYHCRSENLLYIIFWCAILFFYCCTPIVYTVHCTGGDFLFAKSNRNSNNILPFHSNHFVEFT